MRIVQKANYKGAATGENRVKKHDARERFSILARRSVVWSERFNIGIRTRHFRGRRYERADQSGKRIELARRRRRQAKKFNFTLALHPAESAAEIRARLSLL